MLCISSKIDNYLEEFYPKWDNFVASAGNYEGPDKGSAAQYEWGKAKPRRSSPLEREMDWEGKSAPRKLFLFFSLLQTFGLLLFLHSYYLPSNRSVNHHFGILKLEDFFFVVSVKKGAIYRWVDNLSSQLEKVLTQEKKIECDFI